MGDANSTDHDFAQVLDLTPRQQVVTDRPRQPVLYFGVFVIIDDNQRLNISEFILSHWYVPCVIWHLNSSRSLGSSSAASRPQLLLP